MLGVHKTYTKKCMYQVRLDLTDILVLDHEKGVFFMFCSHQNSEPRLLCEPDIYKLNTVNNNSHLEITGNQQIRNFHGLKTCLYNPRCYTSRKYTIKAT